MPPQTTFGTPLIGQTERALGAILKRLLVGRELTQQQWMALSLTINADDGGPPSRSEIVARVGAALQVEQSQADALIGELTDAGLVDATGSQVEASAAGRQLHADIRGAVTEITERLWGDLPSADLETAGRVLATVLVRANAELADD